MKESNIIIGNHSGVPKGGFEIHRYEGNAEDGDLIQEVKGNKLFVNQGGLADDFVSIGLVFRELNHGRKVLLLKNEADRFTIE